MPSLANRIILTSNSLLQSLNLPGSLQALEKPLGLPPSLNTHAEEIRQQDGLHKLRRSMHEINKLKSNDAAMYQEGVGLLKAEAEDDDKARLKHGTERWNRQPSREAAKHLYAKVDEIDGYLKSAASSDDLVKNKLKECEGAIEVLGGTARDLESYVPNSKRTALTPAVERAVDGLRSTLSDVTKLEHRRKKRIQEVREKVKYDDISQSPELSISMTLLIMCRRRNTGRNSSFRARISHAENRACPIRKSFRRPVGNLQRRQRYGISRKRIPITTHNPHQRSKHRVHNRSPW